MLFIEDFLRVSMHDMWLWCKCNAMVRCLLSKAQKAAAAAAVPSHKSTDSILGFDPIKINATDSHAPST